VSGRNGEIIVKKRKKKENDASKTYGPFGMHAERAKKDVSRITTTLKLQKPYVTMTRVTWPASDTYSTRGMAVRLINTLAGEVMCWSELDYLNLLRRSVVIFTGAVT